MPFDAAAATKAYMSTIPAEVTARSNAYTEGGYWLLLIGLLVSLFSIYLVVKSGALPKVRNWIEKKKSRPFLASFLMVSVFTAVQSILVFPLSAFEDHFREKEFGLTKQPFLDWLVQYGIELAISIFLTGILAAFVYLALRKLKNAWWIWASAGGGIFMLVMIFLSPVFIEPLFNEYKAFPEGKVKDAIVELAKKAEVSTDKIYVYDGSRQRSVVTANVAGAFGTARIAVSDIALERASLNEVRAVVAHEIGHYKLGHTLRMALFFSFLLLVAFWSYDKWFAACAKLLGLKDVKDIADPLGYPVMVAFISVFFFAITPIINTFIRQGEIEADNYSLMTAKDPDGLATALIKTVEYRKASPGPIEEFIFHTHPSVENRVKRAMEWKAKNLK